MTAIHFKKRTCLNKRHRLSHQQIDRCLGENRVKEFLPEKMKQLGAVKNFLFVSDLFFKHNISFISFKGPLLSYRIYDDPTVRISHDIDLLIDSEMIDATLEVLLKSGFQLTEGNFWPQKKIQQELLIKTQHHLCFFNPKMNTCVEIHWILMAKLPISLKMQKKIIFENLTEVQFMGRTFNVFSMEFELLYLLIHGARHGWIRLKWLVDIRDYPLSQLDHQKFAELVTLLKSWRIIAQVNVLLNHFFDEELPFGKKKSAERLVRYSLEMIERQNGGMSYSINSELIAHNRYLWFLFPSLHYKCRFIYSMFFNHSDLKSIDSSSRIVYYLYRPYSFIRRRVLHV